MASSTFAAVRGALALLPAVPRRAPAVLSVGGRRRGAAAVVAAAPEDLRHAIDEYPEGILSGEWPDNFSLLSYDDLRAYLESQIITKDKMSPTAKLGDVMSRPVQVAMPGQKLAEIDAFFANHSGLPVLDDEGRCTGIVSRKDKAKASNGLDSTVGEVMSSPAITLTPEKTVLEAAVLMLKNKVHRIPVVNEEQQVMVQSTFFEVSTENQPKLDTPSITSIGEWSISAGIVTRSDVFHALEANKA